MSMCCIVIPFLQLLGLVTVPSKWLWLVAVL